jgi:hypothetical protein
MGAELYILMVTASSIGLGVLSAKEQFATPDASNQMPVNACRHLASGIWHHPQQYNESDCKTLRELQQIISYDSFFSYVQQNVPAVITPS